MAIAIVYYVDPGRIDIPETGLFVRAKGADGSWGSHDIAHLKESSLRAWLTSRGGDNPWAEDVIAHILGHAE